jgi:hypothetical protein
MRLKETMRLVVGSSAIYLLMATLHACGAGTAAPASTTGGMGSGGGLSTSSSGQAGAGGLLNPVDDALAKSGSRLKARWTVGADGSRWNPTIWDSERKESCIWTRAEDGKHRCLPLQGDAVYFLDASCTMPVVGIKLNCNGGAPPPYVTLTSYLDGACAEGTTRVYVIGPPVAKPDMWYANDGAGKCVALPPPEKTAFYAAGAPIPASSFVSSTTEIDE